VLFRVREEGSRAKGIPRDWLSCGSPFSLLITLGTASKKDPYLPHSFQFITCELFYHLTPESESVNK
jgi:hypothetical protein